MNENIKIKENISFGEFNAVVNKVTKDCFTDEGLYDPNTYELSLRTSLLLAFAPDFDLKGCNDNNSLWGKVTSEQAEDILCIIRINKCYQAIIDTIDKKISHRCALITNSSMSMSDIALSALFQTISEKVESIDLMDEDSIKAIAGAYQQVSKAGFEERLVKAMTKNGFIAKQKKQADDKMRERNITISNIAEANKKIKNT